MNFRYKWRLYKLPEKVRIKWYRNFYKHMNKSYHSAGVFLHSTTPISSPVYVAGSDYFLIESPGDEIVTALKVVILLLLITCEINIDQSLIASWKPEYA